MEFLILIIIVVAICTMWGYYYLRFVRVPAQSSVQKANSANGPLIDFPAEPKVFTNQDQAAKDSVLVHSTTYHLEHNNVYYFLQHIQFPAAAKFQGKEQQLLGRLAEDSAKMLHANISWKNTTTFRSLPALNFKLEHTSGSYTSWRGANVLIGTDVYAIKMAWRGSIDEPAFQRFILSFRVPS